MSTVTYPAIFDQLDGIVARTPDRGEGSRFHIRSEFAWDVREDYRRAAERDERLLDELAEDYSFEEVMAACEQAARRAVEGWEAEDAA